MTMSLMDVYNRLPVFAQNIAFSVAGASIQRTRYGAGFRRMLEEFESHKNWSQDQLFEWRDEHLRKLIDHAYHTVPYYHNLMDEGGINPQSIKSAEDLVRLPILTKDMVKENPSAFVSSKTKDMKILHVHTSGTTGSSFQFASNLECQQAQFACFWRFYRQHGLEIGTWQAQFSSRNVVPKRTIKPPFWRIDKPGKRYYMSAFHESPDNLKWYYEIISEQRFEWISGYPSLMTLLAQWMNERGLKFDFVKAVTCGAENLLEHQASAINRAFGVQPVQTYGQTENVAIFSEQPDGKILVDEDFSVVEFLPIKGIKESLVVGTCLFNYATPLIRYCTRDIVSVSGAGGQRREILSLDGRSEDYLVMPDGTKIGKLDHVFKDTPHFKEAQIYQHEDYSVSLRVVGDPHSCIEDEKIALKALRDSVGDAVSVEFEYVPALERTNSAKLRFVVSEVEHGA